MKKGERLESISGLLLKILFIPVGTVLVLGGIWIILSKGSFLDEITNEISGSIFSYLLKHPYSCLILGIYIFIFSATAIVDTYIGFINDKKRRNYTGFIDYQKEHNSSHIFRFIGGVLLSFIFIIIHLLRISSGGSSAPMILNPEIKNFLLIIFCCQILAALIMLLRSDLLKTCSSKDGVVVNSSKPYKIYKQFSDFKLVDIVSCNKRNLEYELRSVFDSQNGNDSSIDLISGKLICIGVSADKKSDFIEMSYGDGRFYFRFCLMGVEKEIELSKGIETQTVIEDYITNARDYL